MTIDSKINHFYDVAMNDAKIVADKQKEDQKEYLLAMVKEHKENQDAHLKAVIKSETDKARLEVSKEISLEELSQKRKYSAYQNDLKKQLFDEVKALLMDYKKTPDYLQLLLGEIHEVRELAGSEEYTIYLSPEDKGLVESLKKQSETPLIISEKAFWGGIRAIIPAKNILVDRSFYTGYQDMFLDFQFELN